MNYFSYYGLDWLAMALSLLAVWLIGNKNQWGFIVFICANLLWIVLGMTLLNSLGILLGNFFFLVTNIRGFVRWNRNASKNVTLQNR